MSIAKTMRENAKKSFQDELDNAVSAFSTMLTKNMKQQAKAGMDRFRMTLDVTNTGAALAFRTDEAGQKALKDALREVEKSSGLTLTLAQTGTGEYAAQEINGVPGDQDSDEE